MNFTENDAVESLVGDLNSVGGLLQFKPELSDSVQEAVYGHLTDEGYSLLRLLGLAEEALINTETLERAVQALLDDGWRHSHEGADGQSENSNEDLEMMAVTVLRSLLS
jgi:hypothetical protein